MLITLSLSILAVLAESAVLDPALFLSPSPPLTLTSDGLRPEELWLQPLEARMERLAREAAEKPETTTDKPAQESGRMFWPRYSAPQPTLGINIPLTFTMSGSYGRHPLTSSGAVGNAYTSITGFGSNLLGKSAVAGNYGRSALAGSSYGSFGSYGAPSVRVYGGESAASWSGWGNGKWGHYGKG